MWKDFRSRVSQNRSKYVHRPSVYLILLLMLVALFGTYQCAKVSDADKAYNQARAKGESSYDENKPISAADIRQSADAYAAVRFWTGVSTACAVAAGLIVALNLAAPIVFRKRPEPGPAS